MQEKDHILPNAACTALLYSIHINHLSEQLGGVPKEDIQDFLENPGTQSFEGVEATMSPGWWNQYLLCVSP